VVPRSARLRTTAGRWVEQAVALALHHRIAFAAALFQPVAVEDPDHAAPVLDDARLLQPAGCLGHPFAANAEHVGDQLLGHGERLVLQSIQGQQQPAAQLLIDGMVAIAGSGLHHLGDQRLGVAQHQVVEFLVAIEFGLEVPTPEPVGMAAALHDRPARRALSAHEQGDAQDAVVADHGDFRGAAILHDVEKGDDGIGGEVDVVQNVAGFVEHLAQRKIGRDQVRRQARPDFLRQHAQKQVLFGNGRLVHEIDGSRRLRSRRPSGFEGMHHAWKTAVVRH
jgi:hypothetical protein